MTRLFLDRSFVVEFLAASTFGRLDESLRHLKVLRELGGDICLVFDITNVSAFVEQMRQAIDPLLMLQHLHSIKSDPFPTQVLERLKLWLSQEQSVLIAASDYVLQKGGQSESVLTEIGYCLWMLAVCKQIDAGLILRSKRAPLLSAIMAKMGFERLLPIQRGLLKLSALSIRGDADACTYGWPAQEILLPVLPELTQNGASIERLTGGLMKQDDTLTILFLAANPRITPSLDLEEEIRLIEDQLRGGKFRDRIEFVARLAARPDDLIRYVREFRPKIVHFSGHGESEGIVLRNDAGGYSIVSASALERFFARRGVSAVILNSCHSQGQAAAISNVVDTVVSTTTSLQDEAALGFSKAFYRTLCEGHSIGEAFRDGTDAVALNSLIDCFTIIGKTDVSYLSR